MLARRLLLSMVDGSVEPVPALLEWMNTKDAAAYLGTTTRRLYRVIEAGHLKGYRFGRVVRLKRDEVERFKASGIMNHLPTNPDDPDDPDGGVAAIVRI